MDLDCQIDELYALPLSEFTASRNTFAKTLSGDEAKRVRALAKPTVVPWAVNQLFWKGRAVYDRLLKQGGALRAAQIAALKGRDADVRLAAEAHRRALSDAVHHAADLASAEGTRPDADDLARMLEAVSLAARPADRPGRWTESIQPAGFEALSGVQPIAGTGKAEAAREPIDAARRTQDSRRQAEADRKETQRLEAERKRLEAAVRDAEQAAARAKTNEARARDAFDRATEARQAAEAGLASARKAAAGRL